MKHPERPYRVPWLVDRHLRPGTCQPEFGPDGRAVGVNIPPESAERIKREGLVPVFDPEWGTVDYLRPVRPGPRAVVKR